MRSAARRALLALAMVVLPALSACVGRQQGRVLTERDAAASDSTMLSEPVVVRGEERFTARVQAVGIVVAELSGRVAPTCDNPSHVRVESVAAPGRLLALVKRITGEMQTTLDGESGLPLKNHIIENEGSTTREFHVEFAGDRFRYRYVKVSPEGRLDFAGRPRAPDGEPVHDMHTAALALRGFRPARGARRHFHVVLGRRLWRVELVYRGPDVVLQDGVPRPALHFEGLGRKLRPSEDGTHKTRSFELWVSRDEERLPLRLIADSKVGLVRVDLEHYERQPDGCFEGPSERRERSD